MSKSSDDEMFHLQVQMNSVRLGIEREKNVRKKVPIRNYEVIVCAIKR